MSRQVLLACGCVFVALSLIPNSHATTFYVSTGGEDSNPGTSEDPLRTISRGAVLAQPGDTVIVREGVYRERVAPPRGGEPGKRITYQAAAGERVILKGSEVWQPEWIEVGEGIYCAIPDPALFNDLQDEYPDSHNPLEVELASTPWQREGRREVERGFKGDETIVYTCGQVFVDGARFKEVPFNEELEPGCWHFEKSSGNIYVHFGETNPAEQFVELTTRRRIFAPTKRGLGYITVQGFIMEHCGNQYPTNFWTTDANAQKGALGIEAGHHWILRRNLIRHAKSFAIDAGYVDKRTPRDMVPHDNLIEENYVVENGSAGILSNRSQNMVIRGNVILRNNLLNFLGMKRWEQAGIKCHHFRDGLIESNYVADNLLTYGVWLDNQFPDSRVTRNVLCNNGRAGIFLEMSDYDFDRLLVDNNIVVGNHENPVYIHDASGATFVHNLLAGTKEQREYGQAVYIRQVSARTKTYHHTFYNNLMLDNSVILDVNYPSHRSGPQRFDYNLYGCSRDEKVFHMNSRSEKPSPWSEEEFIDLVSADSGKEILPQDTGDRHVRISFEGWRQFWQSHGLENDRHSQLSSASEVSYDEKDQTLTLRLALDPKSVKTFAHPKVSKDYLSNDFDGPDGRKPGPFQALEKGENTFKVWHGLPLLKDGELPPKEWNQLSQEDSQKP
ncbi:MAG: right-handed parallel beta-helix repeat-containing protein [Lacipirellulaceae bacterium]